MVPPHHFSLLIITVDVLRVDIADDIVGDTVADIVGDTVFDIVGDTVTVIVGDTVTDIVVDRVEKMVVTDTAVDTILAMEGERSSALLMIQYIVKSCNIMCYNSLINAT